MNPRALILIPTEFEAGLLLPRLKLDDLPVDVATETCGFGPVVAGAHSSQLLARHRPDQVILAGIAGTLSNQLSVGTACCFTSVCLYGVGAGNGENFQTAEELGWSQFPSTKQHNLIGDTIALTSPSHTLSRQLVTCCAASDNKTEADWRRQKFPDAAAEDMEGFSVAAACQLAKIPLQIVRGISNVAGDRDKENWQVEDAIESAAGILKELLTW